VDSLQSGHGPAREAGYGVGHQGAADDREEECGGRASPEGPLGSAWAGGCPTVAGEDGMTLQHTRDPYVHTGVCVRPHPNKSANTRNCLSGSWSVVHCLYGTRGPKSRGLKV